MNKTSTNLFQEDEGDLEVELFDRETENHNDTNNSHFEIPQNTLEETTIAVQHKHQTKHVTLFGYSILNKKNMFNKISQMVKIVKFEEGKNYMNIWCENLNELEDLVKLNQTEINGELIGVFRRNFGVITDDSIYQKEDGIMRRILKYFIK